MSQKSKNPRTEEPNCGILWFFGSLVLSTFAVVNVRATENQPSFAGQLDSLAAKCDELGLKEQADITRGWDIPRHAGRQYLFLPAAGDSSAPKAGSSDSARQWHKRFLELRREQASALRELCRQLHVVVIPWQPGRIKLNR